MHESRGPNLHVRTVVDAYLQTKRGANTPNRIAGLLYNAPWPSIGADEVPTTDQVHWTRCWLEETALEELRDALYRVRACTPDNQVGRGRTVA